MKNNPERPDDGASIERPRPRSKTRVILWLIVALSAAGLPTFAYGYVGPGAGIAFMTTAFVLLSSILVLVGGSFIWPARWVWRFFSRKRPPKKARFKRVVIVGLDGLDPRLARRWLDKGRMPNLARLERQGVFTPLSTTIPAMSPVAWSTFATGVNPGKHGIYDFLTRDPRSYLPDLSSAEISPPSRSLNIGPWQIPLGKPRVRLRRRSRGFWNRLADFSIPSAILRVPITFPPERFEGVMLSAMCVPDLQGSQGTFTHIIADQDATETNSDIDAPTQQTDPYEGGLTIQTTLREDRVETRLIGPVNPIRNDGQRLELPLELRWDRETDRVALWINGDHEVDLEMGQNSPWIELSFSMGLGLKLRGIARFRLLEIGPRMRLYISPINIDPLRPVLPISHPSFFSTFLARLIGRFATLGFAEDTWALNEGVIDEAAFLEQAWANHSEREEMLFEMIKRTPSGLVTCVFDGTDRIQHMFMRYLDDKHPATSEGDHGHVIEETYARCDAMVGRLFEEVDPNDPENLVIVLSDHGFTTFRRGINLNTWLMEQGYLALDESCAETGHSRAWFQGVDWTRTRAFAFGLGGIFLNVKSRERAGVVEPGAEARALAEEIAERLRALIDPANGEHGITQVYLAEDVFEGPYVDEAPDLIIGYNEGWRASWDGARGVVGAPVFTDNVKAWSGDHCIDPSFVPGVLFCNHPLAASALGARPSIADLAPTVLDAFGVPAPRYMDGESLLRDPEVSAPAAPPIGEVSPA